MLHVINLEMPCFEKSEEPEHLASLTPDDPDLQYFPICL